MDWSQQPLLSFLRGPVIGTRDGRLILIGSCVSLIFALLAWISPGAINLTGPSFLGEIIIFSLWPAILFVLYVAFCSPDFRPNWLTSLFIAIAACFPFYLVYR